MATKQSREAVRVWAVWGTAIALVGGLMVAVVADQGEESVTANGRFELGDGVDPLVPGIADIVGSSVQAGPDWGDLFNADRTPKDQYDELGNAVSNGVPDFLDTWGAYRGRRDAAFLADDISAGGATDASVWVGPGLVGPASVPAAYDLGNAYAYAGFADLWNFVLYAGFERLANSPGSIVLEFNRELFSLDPAGEIVGERSVGDLQVKIEFPAGVLTSFTVSSWQIVDPEASIHDWVPAEVLPINPEQAAEQCNGAGTVCAVCNGASVDGGAWANFDAEGNPVAELLPDTFMEFGINLTTLLGLHTWESYYSTRYTSIQVTTYDDAVTPVPQDYVLGDFMRASRLAKAGFQQ